MEPHFFYPAISVESVEYCKALYELLLSEQKVSKADFELKTANLGQCDSATSSPSTWPEDDSIWFEIKIQTKRCRQRPWGPSPPSPSTLHYTAPAPLSDPATLFLMSFANCINTIEMEKYEIFVCLSILGRRRFRWNSSQPSLEHSIFWHRDQDRNIFGLVFDFDTKHVEFSSHEKFTQMYFFESGKKLRIKNFQETFIPSWVNKHFEDKTF